MSLLSDFKLTDPEKSSGSLRSQNLDRCHVGKPLSDRKIAIYRKKGRLGSPWWSCGGRYKSFAEYQRAQAEVMEKRKGLGL
jgi:hypothetical protein